jgi:hypothetical protein
MDRHRLVRAAGVAVIARPVALPALPAALFAGAPFQSGAAWWRCVAAAALPAGARPLFLLAEDGGRPAGLLPLCDGGGSGGLTGLVTPYTCLYQPVLAPDADPAAVGRACARACAAWPVLRLDALDADWPGWRGLLTGFRRAGWRAAWFGSFGNWHGAAADGWEAYLAARPGALRETIRRKLSRTERDPAFAFDLARRPDEVGTALAAYDAVYRRSWKPAEPFPGFAAAFVAAAAAAGVLRLGVLRRGGEPVAAQYWTVEDVAGGDKDRHGRVATVLKLAHDETAKAASPGTVLTAWMIRALLAEGVTSLDFGRGDDPYKQLWVGERRQRSGLILAQPWRPRGALALIRQRLARARQTLRRHAGAAAA